MSTKLRTGENWAVAVAAAVLALLWYFEPILDVDMCRTDPTKSPCDRAVTFVGDNAVAVGGGALAVIVGCRFLASTDVLRRRRRATEPLHHSDAAEGPSSDATPRTA